MTKIAVFLPACPWGPIDESAPGKGLGGRETALVNLCVEWAKVGIEVYAFVPRDQTAVYVPMEGTGFVRWIPGEHILYVLPQIDPDLFISWENMDVIAALRDAGYEGTCAIEMQVAHLDAAPEDLLLVDKICALSPWAKRFLEHQHPTFPADNIVVLPNGITMEHTFHDHVIKDGSDDWDFDAANFIYSSSPDRGLHHLLTMWPEIQEMVQQRSGKKAKLHICYGLENFVGNSRWSHREDGRRALMIEDLIEQDGVVYHGRISQDVLRLYQQRCDAMLYPCDTLQPTETGCLVAGTPIDCPRDFALYPDGVPIEEIEVGQLVWTINEETQIFELKRVQRAWKTRIDAPIWKVTLDSGQVIEGTEEHPFMKRDGSWVEMASLQPGDSLMPLYRDFEPRLRINPNGPNGGAWKDEYKEVGDVLWPDVFGGRDMVVHHEDERHANTSEENLSLLTRNEHRDAHDMRGGWTKVNDEMSPEERAKRIARTTALAGKRWATVPVAERRLYWHKTHPEHRCVKPCDVCEQLYNHVVEKITSNTPGLTMEQRRSYLRWEREAIRREDAKAAGNPFMDDNPKSEFFNHKVISVEFTGAAADVYNLEVEENHNYVVHGVVVHNCISIIEALGMKLPVATTDCDCLGEEFGDYTFMSDHANLPTGYDDYLHMVQAALDCGDVWKTIGQRFAQTRIWPVIAQQWIEEFELEVAHV